MTPKTPNNSFSQLSAAATLGGLAAIVISGTGLYFLSQNGATTGPLCDRTANPFESNTIYCERGSGRNEINDYIATENEDEDDSTEKKPKKQKEEVATEDD